MTNTLVNTALLSNSAIATLSTKELIGVYNEMVDELIANPAVNLQRIRKVSRFSARKTAEIRVAEVRDLVNTVRKVGA